jgi:hypothetical protein
MRILSPFSTASSLSTKQLHLHTDYFIIALIVMNVIIDLQEFKVEVLNGFTNFDELLIN